MHPLIGFFMNVLVDPFCFDGWFFELDGYSVVSCVGDDCVRFFNGQLTNDVSKLSDNQFQGQVRLDRSGKVQFFFYILKKDECFYIIIKNELKDDLMADLDKFIIMDDVSFEDITHSVFLNFSFGGQSSFASLPCDISFSENSDSKKMKALEFEKMSLMGGEPVWDKTILKDQLVTDSIAMLNCVSLEKGCFLGQETVAKIESRRGGAYFPVALKSLDESALASFSVEDKTIAKKIQSIDNFDFVFLKRDYRVEGSVITFDQGEKSTVHYLPLWKGLTGEELAINLFERGAELFQENKENKAVDFMLEAIKVKPDYADAYESLGVIYGRHEKYTEAIKLMNELSVVDPGSVMAHTNKSLYLMKLGKIEEAEEEKAQATLKTFAMYGKEAQDKKALEEKKKQEEAELLRREGMFKQVLELDPEDGLAGYGLADIEYHRKNYDTSLKLLETVLESNPKYSVAYLLYSKCLFETKSSRAKEILLKGIQVASSQGDLMPANNMQELLNKLNKT